MRAKYILPCSCGQEIHVEAVQAGQEVRCVCGAVRTVPTMRNLASLKRAETGPSAAPAKAKSTWGIPQAVMLLGLVITTAALAGGALLHFRFEETKRLFGFQKIETFTPSETWVLWQGLQRGVEFQPPWELDFREAEKLHRRWTNVVLFVAVVGVLTLGSSWLIPKKARTKSVKRSRPGPRGMRPGKGR